MNFGQNLYQWFLSNAQSLVLMFKKNKKQTETIKEPKEKRCVLSR